MALRALGPGREIDEMTEAKAGGPAGEIVFQPIGVIHSPFTDPRDMPIQPSGSRAAPDIGGVCPDYRAEFVDLGSKRVGPPP